MDKSLPNGGKSPTGIKPTRNKKRVIKNILLFLLIAFMVLQFFQPDKNNNTVVVANDITSVVPMSDSVSKILHIACYDCHSNNTDYPWYSNIQPVGWWLASHIKEGKEELNFNEFTTYPTKKQLKKLDKIKKSQKDDWMPLGSYTLIHRDAKLNDAQKQLIMDWADSSVKIITALPVKE